MKTAFINRFAILSTRRTIYTTSTTATIRPSSIFSTQYHTTTKQFKMSSTTINHADASNLTSDQDWATLNSDGSLPSNFPTSNGDTTIAKMGTPIHTSCCPSGTIEFLSEEKKDASEGCCDAVTATLLAMQKKMSTHAPKFLLLTGSLRADSCSRKVAIEVGRILASYGADVKLFDATDLPLFSQDIDPKSNAKAMELRTLTRWCEGMVWISPEVHGNMSAVFKNQVDWMPLTEGANISYASGGW